MKISVAGFLVFLGNHAMVSSTDSGGSGRTMGEVAGERTMGKVVKLLKEMMEKSKEEGEKERDLYAKFKCYCDDQEADKKENIKMTKEEIDMLKNDIEKTKAASSELSTECAELKHQITENEAARADATTLRDEAHETFLSEEEEMNGALGSMEGAIGALSALGFVQNPTGGPEHEKFMSKKSDLIKLKSSVEKAGVKKAMGAVSVWLTAKQKKTLDSFMLAPFSALSISKGGEIVDILKQMLETFKENIKNVQSGEKAAQEAHDKFMKIKEEEFDTMKAAYDEKQTTLGENEEELSSLTESLAAAEDTLASDIEFLAKLQEGCAKKAKEFNERNMLRANEEAAISQAIAILDSDAAFEAFGKVSATSTGATGLLLLQINAHNDVDSVESSRVKILQLVQKAARTQNSFKIAKVAALLEAGNPFDAVLKEIDKMIDILDEDQKVDDEQKDWCAKEMEETEEMKTTKEDKITDLKASIEELDDAINAPETGLLAQIEQTGEDIKANHASKAKETAEREEEKKMYHITIKNCVAAEDLLKQAIKALKRYYDQFDLLQEDPFEGAPDTWEGDSKDMAGQKESGAKVLDMLEFIVKETNKEEDEAHKEEEDAVKAFEKRMEELADELKQLEESLVELKETLAEKEKLLGETKENLARTESDLKAVTKYLAQITPGCDFIKEHYDTRKENRSNEKKALEEAKDLIKDTPAYKKAAEEKL